jgi:predicted acetyltransferase
MNESPEKNDLNSIKNTGEKLNLLVELATKEDLEGYKKLRLEAIKSGDAEMFGVTPESLKEEEEKTDEQWLKDILGPSNFIVVARNGDEIIGMGAARRETEDGSQWRIRQGYVQPKFRNSPERIGKQMFQARLDEIKKRGAKSVMTAVKSNNVVSTHIIESFGFKKVTEHSGDTGLFIIYGLNLNKPE